MTLHTPTLLTVMIAVSLVLAMAIALVGYRQHSERFLWAAGLACQATAYTLFALRGTIPDWPSIVGGNLMMAVSFALYLTGLLKFRRLSWPLWVTWGPVAVVGIGFALMVEQMAPRLVLGALMFAVQTLLLVAAILHRRSTPWLRGEWLIMLGGVVMTSLMLMRLWTTLSGTLKIQLITDGGWIQGLTFLLGITSTLLLAIGLIIMSEERAEQALHMGERFQAYRSRVLELLNSGKPLTELLHEVVRGMEHLYPAMRCSILLLDRDGQRLFVGASPSLPEAYNQAVHGVAIGPAVGSCGTAAYLGQRVVAEDISRHPAWEGYQALAKSAGVAACWSQPIVSSHGQVLGTFAIYHAQPHSPSADDIALIEESAILAGLAIERSRSEEQRREAEAVVQHQALHDGLTQLPNRGLLMSRLEQALAVRRRQKGHGALMFIDLDNFKPLNDQHGHAVGDQLLVEVAQRLRSHVREMDTVARFGGDEFVVLLPELDALAERARQSALEVAHKLLGLLSAPYALHVPHASPDTPPIHHECSASIGVTVFDGSASHPEALLLQADTAMYRAKAEGRHRVHLDTALATPG